jgi:1,2-diacylglycerol 3-alpha-glucosyltransferase
MKIVHLCLSCFYIDGYAYQENQLVAQHVSDGHDVTVIASTESFDANKHHCYVDPSDYIGTDGARVIRLPYRRVGPHGLTAKIRAYPRVGLMLEELKPDAILFHGLCAWEMLTVVKHTKRHPQVLFYADCHEDFNNSARTPFSKWLLHYLFYRQVIRYSLPAIRKVLCVSMESISFAQEMYGVSSEKLEFYPLGGAVYSEKSYKAIRAATRAANGWDEHNMVFVQSGKIDRAKRLSDSLRAFTRLQGSHLRFVIAGKILPDVEDEVRQIIVSDPRVQEIGWIEPTQLGALLCAADVYVQPGSQSATMQMSLCCRRPVVLDDVPSHRALFRHNGFLVSNQSDLNQALTKFAHMSRRQLDEMSSQSAAIASQLLDYRQLALRVLK